MNKEDQKELDKKKKEGRNREYRGNRRIKRKRSNASKAFTVECLGELKKYQLKKIMKTIMMKTINQIYDREKSDNFKLTENLIVNYISID